MPDLDYAKVVGRFALTVGDTASDLDDDPDTIWCDEGRITLTPLTTFAKVPGGIPEPFTAGNSAIECTIDADGFLTYLGKRYVHVVDLASTKVTPRIGPGAATHRVTFADVRADGIVVDFPETTVRLTTAGNDGTGENDLTLAMPVNPGEASPIAVGPPGPSAYQVWLDAGNVGDQAAFLADLTGPTGGQGIQGTPGVGQVNLPTLVVNHYVNPVLATTDGWLAEAHTTIEAVPGAGRNGRNALRVTKSSDGGGVSARADFQNLTVGEVYTVTAWVERSAGTEGVTLAVGNGVTDHVANAAGGRQLQVTFRADATAMSVFHYNAMPGVPGAAATDVGSAFLLSEPILVRGGKPAAYFTGDDPGCYWLGTPRASASVKGLYDADDVLRTDLAPELARNLARDPSCRQHGGGNVTVLTSPQTYDGMTAARVTRQNTNPGAGFGGTEAWLPAGTYLLSVRARRISGAGQRVTVLIFRSDFGVVYNDNAGVNNLELTDAPGEVWDTFTIPPGGASVLLICADDPSTAFTAGSTYDVWGAFVVPTTGGVKPKIEPFDGTSAGCRWLGAPYDSPSAKHLLSRSEYQQLLALLP